MADESWIDEPEEPAAVEPGESPFELPPIEGLPYEKGSLEDIAVRRVIEESDRESAASPDD
jgi:hypothetical protein